MKLNLLLSGFLLITGCAYGQTPTQSREVVSQTTQNELSQAEDYYGELYRILNSDLTVYQLTGNDDTLLEKIDIALVLRKRSEGTTAIHEISGTDKYLEILPIINTESNENE